MGEIAKAIEQPSSRGRGWFETGDREVTDAVILALRELVFLRNLMTDAFFAIHAPQSKINTNQHMSKDGFPGYPAE